MKEYCKEIIHRKGLGKVTVEELVAEITPHGRGEELVLIMKNINIYNYQYLSAPATVPESIKADLLKRIRTFLQST